VSRIDFFEAIANLPRRVAHVPMRLRAGLAVSRSLAAGPAGGSTVSRRIIGATRERTSDGLAGAPRRKVDLNRSPGGMHRSTPASASRPARCSSTSCRAMRSAGALGHGAARRSRSRPARAAGSWWPDAPAPAMRRRPQAAGTRSRSPRAASSSSRSRAGASRAPAAPHERRRTTPDRAEDRSRSHEVASFTKNVTAVATMKLLRERGLSIESHIAPYLPSSWKLSASEAHAVRHVLAHASAHQPDARCSTRRAPPAGC
jgi:hypothetical protein